MPGPEGTSVVNKETMVSELEARIAKLEEQNENLRDALCWLAEALGEYSSSVGRGAGVLDDNAVASIVRRARGAD